MNVTFAWEFGGGMGHLSELIPIAHECARRGHDVSLVLKSLRNLEHFLRDSGIRYLQAPTERPVDLQKFPITATYGQLLHNLGFGEKQHLILKATAWRNQFLFQNPDLVVCNHAPVAMLASRSLGIPYVILGTGFFVCPSRTPHLSIMRADYAPPAEILAIQDARMTENANGFLAGFKAPLLSNIAEIYSGASNTYLSTYSELDHFPERETTVRYWGSWPQGIGDAPNFLSGTGPRIFGYLKPFKALESLLTELNRLKLPTLICGSGISEEMKLRFTSESLAFTPGPVELTAALNQCDFAILNATHGVLSAALIAGKPVLNIPLQLEQSMLAKSYSRLKAGVTAAHRDSEACIKALHFMLQKHKELCVNAQKVSAKYRNHDPQASIVQLVDSLERLSK